MSTFNLIASFSSIIGVLIALWQSSKAKSIAKAAQDAVNSVLVRTQITVYKDIIENGHNVENALNYQRGMSEVKFKNKLRSTLNVMDRFISIANEQKHNIANPSSKLSFEKSLLLINKYRQSFNDENENMRMNVEQILLNTQNIISIVSKEKQSKEFDIA